ncbi:hypothetical protein [Nostocoides sp. Soil756]|jgi:hypothetical protein|uniref:hypothetical protein n=1 Tax=Nostocoides sp. Soil756 TaxID=1736399 RepID=UPI0012FA18BA|nr:hypothetical protein [Tetrasphaera sp. Soil756]
MTHRQPSIQRWWRLLLAATATLVVGVLGAGTASATTLPEVGNRVGASTPVVVNIVGVHESISAGQRWGHAPPQAETASATGVAAKYGDRTVAIVGRRGSPMDVPRGTNAPGSIGGRSYGGHALDEMQSEGFTPSVVEDAIRSGERVTQSTGRISHYSPANNVTVITSDGKVVTVTSGTVKPR